MPTIEVKRRAVVDRRIRQEGGKFVGVMKTVRALVNETAAHENKRG